MRPRLQERLACPLAARPSRALGLLAEAGSTHKTSQHRESAACAIWSQMQPCVLSLPKARPPGLDAILSRADRDLRLLYVAAGTHHVWSPQGGRDAAQHLSWRLVTLVDWPATQMPGLSASQPFTVPTLRLAFRPTSSSTLLRQQASC